jgi:hypothetical protein
MNSSIYICIILIIFIEFEFRTESRSRSCLKGIRAIDGVRTRARAHAGRERERWGDIDSYWKSGDRGRRPSDLKLANCATLSAMSMHPASSWRRRRWVRWVHWARYSLDRERERICIDFATVWRAPLLKALLTSTLSLAHAIILWRHGMRNR